MLAPPAVPRLAATERSAAGGRGSCALTDIQYLSSWSSSSISLMVITFNCIHFKFLFKLVEEHDVLCTQLAKNLWIFVGREGTPALFECCLKSWWQLIWFPTKEINVEFATTQNYFADRTLAFSNHSKSAHNWIFSQRIRILRRTFYQAGVLEWHVEKGNYKAISGVVHAKRMLVLPFTISCVVKSGGKSRHTHSTMYTVQVYTILTRWLGRVSLV